MNTKLTESEYQHMIMELIGQSIERIGELRQDGDEGMTDWIYFIERLKLKGLTSDLNTVRPKTSAKGRFVAKQLRIQFTNENSDKNITTQF